MKRNSWIELGPSLLVAAGILLSSFIEVRTEKLGLWAFAAPVVMGLAIVCGVLLDPRLRGRSSRRLWLALLAACWSLVVAFMLTTGNGHSARVFLPSMGAVMWAALLSGQRRRRNCCETA
ncbi:MAG TPA: hypothetical protein VGN16_11005 [Acidobacteriaceae bacterium]|jgi:drug/metabolite transporter (DMT)-like permease